MNKKVCFSFLLFLLIIFSGCDSDINGLEDTENSNLVLQDFTEYNMAATYHNTQDYDNAIISYQQLLRRMETEKTKNAADEYWIKGMIGRCYVEKKEYEKAEPYIEEAVRELGKIGDTYMLSKVYRTEAEYYYGTSQYNKAMKSYEKSLNYTHDDEIILVYWGMGRTYLAMEQKQEALNYYKLALADGERRGDHAGLVNVYFSLGVYYWTKDKDLEEAKKNFEKGAESAEISWGKNDIKVADAFRYLAQVYSTEKDYQTAYSYCRKAMDIYNSQENISPYMLDLASIYNNMAVYNMELGEYMIATEMIKKSYDTVSEKMGDNVQLRDFYDNILSINIRTLYEEAVDGEDYEIWFRENFEGEGST